VTSAPDGTPESSARRARRAQRSRRSKIIRRSVAIVLAVLLIPVLWSYAHYLTAPGTDPWTARSVEWIRDHGGGGIVNGVEHWWYSNHPPPVGGKPKHGIRRSKAPGQDAVSKKTKAPADARRVDVAAARASQPARQPPAARHAAAGRGRGTRRAARCRGCPACTRRSCDPIRSIRAS
jgi:hypothetical protein